MRRFGYLRDALFLSCCGLYALNRWVVKPLCHVVFFHYWFNDLLLIPCALPPLLLAHRWFGLRDHDRPPGGAEVAAHVAGWSVLFEVIGPRIMPHAVGDPWDAVAYAVGGCAAWLWWRWEYRSGRSGFDFLAPHYRWMEWVLAGSKLQRCRAAFLGEIRSPREVLLVGEGNGRCLAELVRAHPGARFTCVDSSARMLERARRRLDALGLASHAVRFVHADILEWQPPAAQFDLLVSHFFLDCFPQDQLETILARLAAAATPDARWLVADFREPAAGWARWRARLILASMYWFFRRVTRLPAARLTPPDALLGLNGFTLLDRRLSEWGLLHSDLWARARAGGNARSADEAKRPK